MYIFLLDAFPKLLILDLLLLLCIVIVTLFLSLQLGGGGGGMDSLGGLGDIFGAASSSSYVPPAEVRNSGKCWIIRKSFVTPNYLRRGYLR